MRWRWPRLRRKRPPMLDIDEATALAVDPTPVKSQRARCFVGSSDAPEAKRADLVFDPEVELERSLAAWQPRAAPPGYRLLPIVVDGACLEPLVPDGAVGWFDPRLPADDGDVVLLLWFADDLPAGHPERREDESGQVLIKLLRHCAGRRLLVARDTRLDGSPARVLPLGASSRVIGMLREVRADGIPGYRRVA